MRIINIVGNRPNFMRIAPIIETYAVYPEIGVAKREDAKQAP